VQAKLSGLNLLRLLLPVCLAINFAGGLFFSSQAAYGDDANPNSHIVCVEDGDLSQKLHLPTNEWIPKDGAPRGVVLAIHGMTLHASCYDVIGKAFAFHGYYACAADMRGYGRCYTDNDHKFWVGKDSKKKINCEKSYADIVQLAKEIKQKYPNVPFYALGESLGTSYCIRLAADHPEIVDGLILSGPTVKTNPLMVIHPATFSAGAWAVFIDPLFRVSTGPFVKHLVSNDPNVVQEMLNDPLCRKSMTIRDLLQTQKFVGKTISFARKLKVDEPVLVIQGSEDRCMDPKAITTLAKNIPSSEQTLRWLHAHGHLLLETTYLRPATVDALGRWMKQRQNMNADANHESRQELIQLGAKPCVDEL
jgi:alpha-beta hydrolase superfamily lysophospholipase